MNLSKALAVAIILLFFIVSVILSTGTTVVYKTTISTFHDGNTLYVGGNGTGNYSTIQAAINDADWYDTVFVYDDSSPYVENIVIRECPINLIGENKETTIIDGGKNDNVVYIYLADGVKISNFTLQNSAHGWPNCYFGIVIEPDIYNVIITDNIIQDNQGTIFDFGCNTIISNNIIRNNSYGLGLGGVNSIISHNLVENNNYPGVCLCNGAKNNVVSNNIIKNNGGIHYDPYVNEGVWCYSGICFYEDDGDNNVYQNNITGSDYGIFMKLESCGNNNIYQNTIIENIVVIRVERGGKGNLFYQNNFVGNILINPIDWGDNQWDNGSVGNYWSDYKIRGGYDDDGDGIGDIPYKIRPYWRGNKDNYPLMKPYGNITSYNKNSQSSSTRPSSYIPNSQNTMSVIPSTGITVVDKTTISTFHDGNTLYVGGNGTGNYTKIQDAIDDASDGDTVYVYDDSSPYYENIGIDKSINLIGENKETTVIDGGSSTWDFAIFLSAPSITICGFTVQCYSTYGKGIWVYNATGEDGSYNNTIYDNIIKDTKMFGIILESSSGNKIFGNEIRNHFGDMRGVGVAICANYGAALNNLVYENNITNNRYGIYITSIEGEPCDNNKIYHNNFIGNNYNARSDDDNIWDSNYWDNWIGLKINLPIFQKFPKVIWGFPWINFDWRPAREPYDIPNSV